VRSTSSFPVEFTGEVVPFPIEVTDLNWTNELGFSSNKGGLVDRQWREEGQVKLVKPGGIWGGLFVRHY